jgi:seryl-tRNA synthetase
MKEFQLETGDLAPQAVDQLVYALYFADEGIENVERGTDGLRIIHRSAREEAELRTLADRLRERFSKAEFGFKEQVIFENRVDTPYDGNIIADLHEQKILKELEAGMYTFREPFVTLLQFFDHTFARRIGGAFGAKQEYYPVVIHGETLDKTNHFTSFPEHIHFVAHLREDLDVIEEFASTVRAAGSWKETPPTDLTRTMIQPRFTINPATCYHCYEGLQGETLEGDGVVVTAASKVHRYESKNHRQFGRLLDFTMREVIFVGKPDWVKANRLKSIELLQELVREWELDAYMENANDPFFTNDFQVKASFQRQQEMKYELRLNIPFLQKSISVSSSNFHSTTFGSAFGIKAGKRPAVTGCLAFGLERWVFAFLAQYGLDETRWPGTLRTAYAGWREQNGV